MYQRRFFAIPFELVKIQVDRSADGVDGLKKSSQELARSYFALGYSIEWPNGTPGDGYPSIYYQYIVDDGVPEIEVHGDGHANS